MEFSRDILDELFSRSPSLGPLRKDAEQAFSLISGGFEKGGKLLVCGNGGSAADAEHIVGELMKGFLLKRPIPEDDRKMLETSGGPEGMRIGELLQGALPAISLAGHPSLRSAIANDTADDMVYAQQVYGYGNEGDVLMGISTSGNAKNVVHAVLTARAFGLTTIALTGCDGGTLAGLCDCVIRAPSDTVPVVQEYHVQIYHALCAMLEAHFFGPRR